MIDTNILLDWLLDRDALRTRQIDALLAESKELYVPDVVVVELAFALERHYELPRDVVADSLKSVLTEPALGCDHALFQRVIGEYETHPAWSFLDCYLVCYSELRHISPVWTYDKKLVRQSGGRAKEPRDL